MISLQEMTAWTSRDIAQAIQASQPQGWRFTIEQDRGVFAVTFTDAEGKIVWEREGFDERLLLFDAFGWLQRRQVPRTNPVWSRRHGDRHRPQVGPLSGVRVSDPEDLDPAEIATVYTEHLSRRK